MMNKVYVVVIDTTDEFGNLTKVRIITYPIQQIGEV